MNVLEMYQNTGENPMLLSRRHMMKSALLLSAMPGMVARARAQAPFPSKPVKLIVPYAAGGGTDAIARLIAQAVSASLGQTIIVDNNGGAGGNIATMQAANAAKDGYTLLMANQGPMVVNPHLFSSLTVDPLKAFDPVTLIAAAPLVLVVPKDSPYKSFGEIIDFARKNPDKLNYGSAGNGSASHLATLLLAHTAKFQASHVPYRGAGPAITDLVGGRIDFMVTTLPSIVGQLGGGAVRALAMTSKARVAVYPDIPTVAELGWPDYEASAWYGFVAPAGTPRPVIDRLRTATIEAIQSASLKERLHQEGAAPIGTAPEEFRKYMAEEHARWGALVKAAGLKLD